MSGISVAARQELVQTVGERYREGTADAKRRILDEFVALTGKSPEARHSGPEWEGPDTGCHEARAPAPLR